METERRNVQPPWERSTDNFPFHPSSGYGRRCTQSGPLPFHHEAQTTLQDLFLRPSHYSGPLPSLNPYDPAEPSIAKASDDCEEFPPVKTPPPWSELRQVEELAIASSASSSSALTLLPKPSIPVRKVPIPNLNRSLTLYVSAKASIAPTVNRSMSFDTMKKAIAEAEEGQDGKGTVYTKATSLVDDVVESLVRQLVRRQDRPNVLANMIFSNSKLTSCSNGIVLSNPFSATRLFAERIFLVQLRPLSPKLMAIASDPLKFEKQKWALKGQQHNNGKTQYIEDDSNAGLRLLHLQKRFVELSLESFDLLCKLHYQLPDLVAEDVSTGHGLLHIACIGGGPGCSALALHLFFLRHSSCLENTVKLTSIDAEWKEIVECISLKGIGIVEMELMELIRHPSMLRSYKLIAFFNILGEENRLGGQWQSFWNKLYQNTTAMVLIIIYEASIRWEEIMPNRGQWWCSSVRDQDNLHIVRKI